MAAPIRPGEEVELRIDSLAYGGNGVARLDGFVVFVRGGLPGDLVRARATKVKRGFAEATRTALVEPGPDRVPAPCRLPAWLPMRLARRFDVAISLSWWGRC